MLIAVAGAGAAKKRAWLRLWVSGPDRGGEGVVSAIDLEIVLVGRRAARDLLVGMEVSESGMT